MKSFPIRRDAVAKTNSLFAKKRMERLRWITGNANMGWNETGWCGSGLFSGDIHDNVADWCVCFH